MQAKVRSLSEKYMSTRTDDPVILPPKLPLNLLMLEDNPDDAELCLSVLRKAQLDVCLEIVGTREEFLARLRSTTYDAILADYNLGSWTGMDALQILVDQGSESPLILVTGALGEQKAIECIKAGVSDYILKERLERLPTAILRAVEGKGLGVQRAQLERSLHESETTFRTLAEAMPEGIFIEEGTRCRYANRAAEKITGYSREELLSNHFWQLLLPDSRDAVLSQMIRRFQKDEPTRRYEIEILTKQKEVKPLNVALGMLPLDGGIAALITAFEVDTPNDSSHRVSPKPENRFRSGTSRLPSSRSVCT